MAHCFAVAKTSVTGDGFERQDGMSFDGPPEQQGNLRICSIEIASNQSPYDRQGVGR